MALAACAPRAVYTVDACLMSPSRSLLGWWVRLMRVTVKPLARVLPVVALSPTPELLITILDEVSQAELRIQRCFRFRAPSNRGLSAGRRLLLQSRRLVTQLATSTECLLQASPAPLHGATI